MASIASTCIDVVAAAAADGKAATVVPLNAVLAASNRSNPPELVEVRRLDYPPPTYVLTRVLFALSRSRR